jgi:hypothetical protein
MGCNRFVLILWVDTGEVLRCETFMGVFSKLLCGEVLGLPLIDMACRLVQKYFVIVYVHGI